MLQSTGEEEIEDYGPATVRRLRPVPLHLRDVYLLSQDNPTVSLITHDQDAKEGGDPAAAGTYPNVAWP